jgi:hypothetical protein
LLLDVVEVRLDFLLDFFAVALLVLVFLLVVFFAAEVLVVDFFRAAVLVVVFFAAGLGLEAFPPPAAFTAFLAAPLRGALTAGSSSRGANGLTGLPKRSCQRAWTDSTPELFRAS